MNIYIYGNSSFKKDIHKTLNQANIKYKLDENSVIKDINNLEELKNTIKEYPKYIYLIDDEKIIKKNALSQKIKFLAPKDGIEEDFLLENGIGDLSLDSLNDIPKYILLKYEQEKAQSEDIQNSIMDIVDDAYNENIELDEELAGLLAHEEPIKNDEIEESEHNQENKDFPFEKKLDFDSVEKNDENEINDVNLDRIDELISFQENVGLNNVSYDYDDKNLVEEDSEEVKITNEQEFETKEFSEENIIRKGENMSDEYSELDSLTEEDILSALNEVEIKNSSSENKTEMKSENIQSVVEKNDSLELNNSNVNDISELISKLLNNKTLEITVKIKD